MRIFCALWVFVVLAGCAAVPYPYGRDIEGPKALALRDRESQIERGRPIAFVDGLGHYFFSLPTKLILWNWSVENHRITPETEQALCDYLAANDLRQVKVRLNEYAPGGEWSRLVRNREIGGGWRYTLGVLSTVFYTIFPGRVFGGDHYNPYTNTISIYSDHPSIALHEGAHAKDFAQRELKGLYAASRMIPLFPLYQEAWATGDAIGFHRDQQAAEAEKNDYRVLYPAYGTYIAGESLGIASWFGPISYPVELAVQAAVAIPGHVVGRIKASQVDEAPEPTDSAVVAEDIL
ncbi:MAG: hypothetical protein A2X84_03635 [Desulfuromonadaceae bacterium GWC2_58_13]|nr:MAG: hypothetical protein A2X84_03635 [Desulfuromonadaceae bacterium GWC2_58_13]